MDDEFGWWFAGLTDGEGCFDIKPVSDYFICRFTIGLRADDEPLLQRVQQDTGVGKLRIQRMRNGAAPQVRWEVARKAEVAKLAEIFDRYPPQSKKSRDFVIWREAVEIWRSSRRGSRWHGKSPHTEQLRLLRHRLRAARTWPASEGSVPN